MKCCKNVFFLVILVTTAVAAVNIDVVVVLDTVDVVVDADVNPAVAAVNIDVVVVLDTVDAAAVVYVVAAVAAVVTAVDDVAGWKCQNV